MITQAAALIERVRTSNPLIHHITNYVTVNDCANITLAIGASPIMADALAEAADIAAMAQAVVLNMGTLNERTIPAMLAAGAAANRAGIPVVLDPVGAGASPLRGDTARQILDAVALTVLRGNSSEIRFMAGLSSSTKGVDASDSDLASDSDAMAVAKAAAQKLGCTVVITGPVDTVSNGVHGWRIANGHPMLARLTGTGCMCSSLIGSFCGAAPDAPLTACIAALLTEGIAGEIAYEQAGAQGTGSFRVAFHDAVSRMTADTLVGRAKLYEA
ncbi:hydroxyethylthiazole kinase [Ruminococcaceae bacterium OttesenSCG-928-L11]|nr:hydroxyethylthiazole kinase [Ruminococcaceae bacterium OttesenSCG-928-L11]